MDLATDSIDCGYCLEEGEQLVDPRLLPCNHTHCYPCLVGNFETNRIVRCGKCKEVFDVSLARLPSAAKREDNLQLCDVCAENGTKDNAAVSYCTSCSKKMCSKHSEPHQEFFPLHKDILSIEEYKRKYKKLEIRTCERHEKKPIIVGCSTCCHVLCVSCMDGTRQCAGGSAHQGVILEELVKVLKAKKDEVKVEAKAKEEKLSELLKSSTRILSEFERKTEELLDLLHSTRDEQITELQRKYDELEGELIEERRRSKEQLVDFMEREIGVRLTEMNTLLVLQDARFRDAHRVDIVSSFAETTREIRRFIDEDLPAITLTNQRKLSPKGKERDIEMKLIEDVNIHVRQLPPPTSLTLEDNISTSRGYYAVYHYNGFTYAGRWRNVDRIEFANNSVTSLLSTDSYSSTFGLCIYNDKLYVLFSTSTVVVSDLEGRPITSWKHADDLMYSNKLVVMGDQVIVPNRSKKQLTAYSLDGQVIKLIDFPQHGEWTHTALCAPDKESVVISSAGTSSVFRVHLETGEVVWTSTDVTAPGGITCYKEEYILVTPLQSSQVEIHVLVAKTGKYLGKIVDLKKKRTSYVYDLHVTENTLIVPRWNENQVLFYELKSEGT